MASDPPHMPACSSGGHATWRAYVKDVPIADIAAGRALAAGSPGCSATANVAVRQDADSVAHVREHSGAPWRIDGSLPRRAPCHVGRLKGIHRHVPMRASVSLRRPIAPRSQGPWNPGKRGEVLLVVPRVEIVLRLGRDVHRIEKQRP